MPVQQAAHTLAWTFRKLRDHLSLLASLTEVDWWVRMDEDAEDFDPSSAEEVFELDEQEAAQRSFSEARTFVKRLDQVPSAWIPWGLEEKRRVDEGAGWELRGGSDAYGDPVVVATLTFGYGYHGDADGDWELHTGERGHREFLARSTNVLGALWSSGLLETPLQIEARRAAEAERVRALAEGEGAGSWTLPIPTVMASPSDFVAAAKAAGIAPERVMREFSSWPERRGRG